MSLPYINYIVCVFYIYGVYTIYILYIYYSSICYIYTLYCIYICILIVYNILFTSYCIYYIVYIKIVNIILYILYCIYYLYILNNIFILLVIYTAISRTWFKQKKSVVLGIMIYVPLPISSWSEVPALHVRLHRQLWKRCARHWFHGNFCTTSVGEAMGVRNMCTFFNTYYIYVPNII